MNKLFGVFIILLTVWVVKLSIDIYTLENQRVKALNHSLEQQNQRIATLYDQMIAVQEQQAKLNTQPISANIQTRAVENQNVSEHYQDQQHYIIDRLALIQANLQQQRVSIALEQTQNLRQKLAQEQPLAESLNTALIEALVRDQNTMTLYLQQRAEHQFILQQQLNSISQKLKPAMLDSRDSKWQWSSWLSIGRAEQIPDMQNRILHYKELQLRLLLAQHALYSGQPTFYKAQIKDIIEGLSAYPDRNTHSIVTHLQKLESMALTTPPQLSALALMQN